MISLFSREKPILILLMILLLGGLKAQICTGNIGDNIFEEGDFGTGSPNNVQQNPNIAPG